METKEEAEGKEDNPPSPLWELNNTMVPHPSLPLLSSLFFTFTVDFLNPSAKLVTISSIKNQVSATFSNQDRYSVVHAWKLELQPPSLQRLYYPMAPRKIDQVGSKSQTEKKLRVRVEAKRVKAEMGKVREQQECLKDKQRKLITRFDEIAKQCDELKQETEMIEKQSAITRAKLVLMFRILKARESGDSVQAANLTRLLREIVAMEKENAIVEEAKDEEDP
ncbi:hypothetical protein V6N13_045172 [Hibiscus sabdariffa]|uniref:Uncharacterized protein n=1 Tax=Hibiscus sabdariffa TaxID=183260 RepID=A0ABR2RKJ0_9ROSI